MVFAEGVRKSIVLPNAGVEARQGLPNRTAPKGETKPAEGASDEDLFKNFGLQQ